MDREIEMMRESMNGRIFREKDERIAELEAEVERLETTLESFAAVDRARQAENAALKSRLSDYEEDDEQCPHGLAGLCEQCIVEGK